MTATATDRDRVTENPARTAPLPTRHEVPSVWASAGANGTAHNHGPVKYDPAPRDRMGRLTTGDLRPMRRELARYDRLRFQVEFTAGTVRLRSGLDWFERRERGPDGGSGADLEALARLLDPFGMAFLYAGATSTRGKISGWSWRSRVRMMAAIAAVDWTKPDGVMEMLTLTYPGEFPTDGRVVKAHLEAFKMRLERQWGPVVGTWKMEFQRRGAPHFHLYLSRPVICEWTPPGGEPLFGWRAYTEWCARAWYEVVGSGDPFHLRAGVGLDRQFCSKARSSKAIAWYFSKHGLKAGDKAYQNIIPAGFTECGRFWGIWGIRPVVTVQELTLDGFLSMRRVLVRLRQANVNYKVRARGRLSGLWAMVDDPPTVAVQLGQLCFPARFVHRETGEMRSWPPGVPRPLP